MSSKLLVTILLFLGLSLCNGYRILAIFPYHGRSHTGVYQEITKALAAKGHQVDVVSHFPLKKAPPNYRDIVQLPYTGKPDTIDFRTFSETEELLKEIHNLIGIMCDHLGTPGLSELIKNQKSNPTYDVLLVHYLFGSQCFTGIGHLLNIPVVGIITGALSPAMNNFVGNPLNVALPPCKYCVKVDSLMTFWERLNNIYMTITDINNFHKISEHQQYYIHKYLGPEMPHFTELEKSISLLLTNSHYSYNGIKPKIPAVVEIGGIQIKNDTTPMESSVKKFLDDSTNGFIYFSYGSLVKIETFPEELINKFYKTFRKLSPVRFIIRVAKPELLPKNLPDNVYTGSWLPQQQIFQHPNIKGFVTHGGAHSTQEAIYHSIPMICMPFFSDQNDNCNLLVSKNLAIKLDFRTAIQEDYYDAFKKISSDPLYKKTIKKISHVFRDRPRAPTEEATYWIEYVTRHGKNALKSPAVHMKWWQVENIDVYAFITTIVLLIFSIFIYIIHKILKIMVFGKMFHNTVNTNKINNKKLK